MRRDPFAKPGSRPEPESPKVSAGRQTASKPDRSCRQAKAAALPRITPDMAKAIAAIPDSTLQYLVQQEGFTMTPDTARHTLTLHCREHSEFKDWRDAWISLAAQIHAGHPQPDCSAIPPIVDPVGITSRAPCQQRPTKDWRKNFLKRARHWRMP